MKVNQTYILPLAVIAVIFVALLLIGWRPSGFSLGPLEISPPDQNSDNPQSLNIRDSARIEFMDSVIEGANINNSSQIKFNKTRIIE